MATLAAFLEGVRYDLTDYETGLEFDDRELINYLNRMIVRLQLKESEDNQEKEFLKNIQNRRIELMKTISVREVKKGGSEQ